MRLPCINGIEQIKFSSILIFLTLISLKQVLRNSTLLTSENVEEIIIVMNANIYGAYSVL